MKRELRRDALLVARRREPGLGLHVEECDAVITTERRALTPCGGVRSCDHTEHLVGIFAGPAAGMGGEVGLASNPFREFLRRRVRFVRLQREGAKDEEPEPTGVLLVDNRRGMEAHRPLPGVKDECAEEGPDVPNG